MGIFGFGRLGLFCFGGTAVSDFRFRRRGLFRFGDTAVFLEFKLRRWFLLVGWAPSLSNFSVWRSSCFASAAHAFRVRRARRLGFLLKSIFLGVGPRGILVVVSVSAVESFRFRGACVSGSPRPQVRIFAEINFPRRWSAWYLGNGFRVSR